MSESMESTRDRLVDEFSEVISHAEETLKRANAETGEKARELRSQAEGMLLRGKLRLQELQGQALDRSRAAARATDDYVHENPWPVLAAAAIVGFAVGMLMNRD